jgi:hypothetical protein
MWSAEIGGEDDVLPLLFALQVAAHDVPVQGKVDPIVVVGQQIGDASTNLKTCLQRHCKPDEDIRATLRLAETQLLAGKYHDARTTLLASLSRNEGWAKAYPVPVSELYRANGKVAAHLGFDKDYFRSTFGIYHTLKNGLPPDDSRKYMALMEVAEMMYRTRGHTRARYYYERLADEARRGGRDDIAAIAELRSAIRHLPAGSSMQMIAIRKVANLQGDKMRAPVLEAKLALARMAYQQGDEATAQAIQDELARFNIKRPMLIYQPSYAMVARELDSGSEFAFPLAPPSALSGDPTGGVSDDVAGPRAAEPASPGGGNPNGVQSSPRAALTSILTLSQWSSTKRIAGNFEDMWADISFRVMPDGKVADVQIIRSKGNLFWTKPLLVSMSMRRYTAGRPNDPASIRTERYTYTSGYETQTGTRSQQHSPKARVEYIDLSDIAAIE